MDRSHGSQLQYQKKDVETLKALGYKYIVVNAEYFKGELQPMHSYNRTTEILRPILGDPKIYPDNVAVFNLK